MLNLTDVNETPAARPPRKRWVRWIGVFHPRQPAVPATNDPNIIALQPYLERHLNSRVRHGAKNHGNR